MIINYKTKQFLFVTDPFNFIPGNLKLTFRLQTKESFRHYSQ